MYKIFALTLQILRSARDYLFFGIQFKEFVHRVVFRNFRAVYCDVTNYLRRGTHLFIYYWWFCINFGGLNKLGRILL